MSKAEYPFREPLPHERVPSPGIYKGGKPLLILPEGSERVRREDALTQHVRIVNGVKDLVKSCFGPNGMYKLILSETGANFLTNDSFTILTRAKLDHPLAQVIAGAGVDAARSSGGGSTTAILLTSEILNALLPLLRMGFKPVTLLKGCSLAYRRVRSLHSKTSTVQVDPESFIEPMVETVLAGTILSSSRSKFAGIVREAVERMGVLKTREFRRLDDIQVRTQAGGDVSESRVVDGLALMREPIHPDMPTHFENAKLLLVRGEFQFPKQGATQYYEHKFQVNSPKEYGRLLRSKRGVLVRLLGAIPNCKANIIIVEEGIDEVIVDYFVGHGVGVIRRFPPTEFEHVVEVTGATPVTDFNDASPSNLVNVARATYSKVGDSWWWMLEGFDASRSCEVLVRGTDQLFFDEVTRLVKSCFRQVRLYLEEPATTYGGGWFEMMVAKDLRDYARTISSKEQIVVERLADSFESIPSLLAESAGLDKVDSIVRLRSLAHKTNRPYGIDGERRRIGDMKEARVVEPLHVKMQSLQSAFEAAITILRVNYVIRSRRLRKEEQYYVERQEKTSAEATRKIERDYGI